MVKAPGLYLDIGKKARDLLYKDYQSDHKFTVTTYTSTGVVEVSAKAMSFEQYFRPTLVLVVLQRLLDQDTTT